MNGKQAKRLRRAAIGLAATLTEAGKKIDYTGYQEIRTVKAGATVDPDATAVERTAAKTFSVQYKLRPDTMKGIYRKLKTGKV